MPQGDTVDGAKGTVSRAVKVKRATVRLSLGVMRLQVRTHGGRKQLGGRTPPPTPGLPSLDQEQVQGSDQLAGKGLAQPPSLSTFALLLESSCSILIKNLLLLKSLEFIQKDVNWTDSFKCSIAPFQKEMGFEWCGLRHRQWVKGAV